MRINVQGFLQRELSLAIFLSNFAAIMTALAGDQNQPAQRKPRPSAPETFIYQLSALFKHSTDKRLSAINGANHLPSFTAHFYYIQNYSTAIEIPKMKCTAHLMLLRISFLWK